MPCLKMSLTPGPNESSSEAMWFQVRCHVRPSRVLLASWPRTFRTEMDGLGKVLFCHATPRNPNDIFTRLTHSDRISSLLGALDVDVVVCGHTHMQFDRMIDTVRVVNAGSVGMPFGEPGAYWLLLSSQIDFRRTVYDLEKAA